MQISELFDENWTTFDLQSTEKWNVISELVDLLFANNRINSTENFLKDIEKREAQVSTGVGYGIAIPHAKSPAVLNPSIAFGKSDHGIDYDSIDGDPVHLVFLLAIPDALENETYIRTLADLSRALVHEEVREKLLTATSFESLLSAFDENHQMR